MTVDVSSQISGQVQEVRVDFNSKVKAGDVLARLDPSTYQQNLKQSEADLASAKANNQLLRLNAERTRELFGKHLVSPTGSRRGRSPAGAIRRHDDDPHRRPWKTPRSISPAAPFTRRSTAWCSRALTDKGRTVAASLNAPPCSRS
jgi:HlyD family secretion protein